MSKSTLPRLKALRDEMGKAGITAFIIPGTDPHQSEYYASHWAARTWISGFDGSAGTAVVTTKQILASGEYNLVASSKPLNNWKIPGSNFLKKDCPTLPPSSNGY